MITCNAVAKRYARKAILEDINLRIDPGICALLGANGAGKSTLLRLLSGLERPDHGSVSLCGLDFASNSVTIRRRLGVVPEQLGLFESLTVFENIVAIGPIYGLSGDESEARAFDLIGLLDLDHGRHTTVRDCSFGMRKKTALAMALLYRPDVLLLDEPFEGIDPASSLVIERLLRERAVAGTTILMTTHILAIVQRLATRVLLLHDGHIAADFDPAQNEWSVEQRYFNVVGRPRQETPPWLKD